MDISKLIADLSSHNVESFEGYGIKISFHRDLFKNDKHISKESDVAPVLVKESPSIPQEDQGLAQSLDAELPYDKVLNWSASADQSESETPLTGDSAPLTNQA